MSEANSNPIAGIPIVVTGPSGVGKGTVIALLRKMNPQVIVSVSMTTRPPRPGEVEGVNYFFVSRETFEQAIQNNRLVEWAEVYGHYYGTPRRFVEMHTGQGRDVILEIDVQGAASVKTLYPNGALIYVMPPTLEELRRRLYSRCKGMGDDLERRFASAMEELKFIDLFDYVVVNEEAPQAAQELNAILTAARLQTQRTKSVLTPLQALAKIGT